MKMQKILLKIITVFLINYNGIFSIAKTYYSDPCITKTEQGICKTWLDCPYIETLIKRGEYTVEEVVHCGFEGTGSNGEIICCPLNKSHFKNPPDVNDRPDIVETNTIQPKLWPDMLTTTTEISDILKIATNTNTPSIYTAENVAVSSTLMDNKQCLNCNLELVATSHMRNYTDDNYIKFNHGGQDKDKDLYNANETKNQQIQELINNVFQINVSKEIESTSKPENLHSFNEAKFQSDINERKQNFSNVINLEMDNFQFDHSQHSNFIQEFKATNVNPVSEQSKHLLPQVPTGKQQQFMHNTQLLDQYNLDQSINQYQLSPPLQPSLQQIQNFQFQLPSFPSQLLNELIQLLNSKIRQSQTLSGEFGVLAHPTSGQSQTSSNVRQNISQAELERYIRSVLQLQENQIYNILGSLNQIPQSYAYSDLKMALLQQIAQNQFQNSGVAWPQQQLKQQTLVGYEIPTNNIMLNQMNFNPQSSAIAPIPADMINQMQFHRHTPQNFINDITPVAIKATTAISDTFNPMVRPQAQPLQRPIEQHQLQQQLYNKKSPLSNNTAIPQDVYDPLKDRNDNFNFTTSSKNFDDNLNENLNYSQVDNIWYVIKDENQSQSRHSKKSAKMISLPHIATFDDNTTESQTIERSTLTTIRTTSANEIRPAVQACNVLEGGLFNYITPHILGGVPSEWGEFPHMAAIGYSRIGEDGPPYDIKCGGTLISSRFILTAAHCVSRRNERPKIVRLGVVNFNDPEQMKFLVELKIKRQIIHENYSLGSSYNDIALLELENKVTFTQYIYPSCLYTNVNDPLETDILYVTGWGVVNLTTRAYSDILLKAPLKITPLEECDKRLREYGLPRQLERGVLNSLLCAWDKNQEKDACRGDSGGPLNLQIDESTRNYRIVGIVISGFECASSTPGLYIRVAEYLDFIEKYVWPNKQYDNEIVEQFISKLSIQTKLKSIIRLNNNSTTIIN